MFFTLVGDFARLKVCLHIRNTHHENIWISWADFPRGEVIHAREPIEGLIHDQAIEEARHYVMIAKDR